MLTGKRIAVAGSLLCALGVALGAFGAHSLKAVLSPERLDVYKTAVYYFQLHALALFVVGLLLIKTKERLFRIAAVTMFVGLVFFCGSLFALIATDVAIFGVLTPIGGALFISSWALVAMATHRGFSRADSAS